MKNNQAATIYRKVMAEMEQKAPLEAIQPLLESLADIGCIDWFDHVGLTICMRAAALGNLEVVKAAHAFGASLELRNKLTNANLLHYAALQPEGGAEIVKWAILHENASDDLLSQQILVLKEDREKDKDWDRGNGHTVAFEAVFNNNVGVVEALIEIERQGHKVDFKKPAVHGRSPLGWSLNNIGARKVVDLLGPKLRPLQNSMNEWREEEASDTKEYAKSKDNEWESNHPQDVRALELAQDLRDYIVKGPTNGQQIENLLDLAIQEGVDPNKPYGRFGQPLLILVPTHPDIMNRRPDSNQTGRYTMVVRMLMDRKADPRTREKGLMEVNAGFREVFLGFLDALELMILRVDQSDRPTFINEVGFFNGYTRLIDAALIGNTEAINLLLRHNPDRHIRGFNGWTACAAAKIYNDNADQGIPEEVLRCLCEQLKS